MFRRVLVLIAALVIGCSTVEDDDEEVSSSGPPAARLSAEQLFAEYEANEVAADEKYKDKVIVVRGTIQDIGKDIVDTMYVTLEAGSPVFSVQCMFADAQKSELVNAAKGQQVSVKGKCDGKLGNVLLRGCHFE